MARSSQRPRGRDHRVWAWLSRVGVAVACGRGHHEGQPRKQRSEEALVVDFDAPKGKRDALSTKFLLGLYAWERSRSTETKSHPNPKTR